MTNNPRTLLVGGVVLLALAAVFYGMLRLTYGQRSAYVHVRWAPNVDEATRHRIERAHSLTPVEFREQRTWGYYLTDLSTGNIRSLVADPAVEDTHHINRARFRIVRDAPRGAYNGNRPEWIARMMELLADAGLYAGAVAIVIGVFRQWRSTRRQAVT